uniref:Uncharacterized protein n=1 Tax=Arundo donax TaxID=35708 RepID=A0A0A8YDV6_ARUDO
MEQRRVCCCRLWGPKRWKRGAWQRKMLPGLIVASLMVAIQNMQQEMCREWRWMRVLGLIQNTRLGMKRTWALSVLSLSNKWLGGRLLEGVSSCRFCCRIGTIRNKRLLRELVGQIRRHPRRQSLVWKGRDPGKRRSGRLMV